MIHLAFPEIGDEHAWLAEGLAVYVEGVARTQAGNETPEELWAGLMNDMPQGEPQAGDAGLDHTHTWGRTYWGGAIFCLQADVLIRERTANRKGLQDALREVLRVTGGNTREMPIGRALAIGDAATGTTVLTELYGAHAFTPQAFDLEAIWKKLGIEKRDGHIVLDDNAPLAAARRAITRS
jgi:predicted metalloprotease with PDZ domain